MIERLFRTSASFGKSSQNCLSLRLNSILCSANNRFSWSLDSTEPRVGVFSHMKLWRPRRMGPALHVGFHVSGWKSLIERHSRVFVLNLKFRTSQSDEMAEKIIQNIDYIDKRSLGIPKFLRMFLRFLFIIAPIYWSVYPHVDFIKIPTSSYIAIAVFKHNWMKEHKKRQDNLWTAVLVPSFNWPLLLIQIIIQLIFLLFNNLLIQCIGNNFVILYWSSASSKSYRVSQKCIVKIKVYPNNNKDAFCNLYSGKLTKDTKM